eukprot:161036-Pelagomonas_calceolata.AAC.3
MAGCTQRVICSLHILHGRQMVHALNAKDPARYIHPKRRPFGGIAISLFMEALAALLQAAEAMAAAEMALVLSACSCMFNMTNAKLYVCVCVRSKLQGPLVVECAHQCVWLVLMPTAGERA